MGLQVGNEQQHWQVSPTQVFSPQSREERARQIWGPEVSIPHICIIFLEVDQGLGRGRATF
jgi:hypothetical protein